MTRIYSWNHCRTCKVPFEKARKKNLCNRCVRANHRQKNRKEMEEFFAQGYVICGEQDREVLDAHHLDPNTKIRNLHSMVGRMSTGGFRAEIEKCIPLCANDHRRIHAGTRQFPAEVNDKGPDRSDAGPDLIARTNGV